MRHLIDSEKLKAEIERRKKIHQQSYKQFHDERFIIDECEDDRILSFIESMEKEQNMGEVSDGYHTFNELYYYRMLYNAAFFNLLPKEWVHKSKRHHMGEECFGGGWFIVMANLPTGQVSNHYELKDWDLFKVPEQDIADEWDGHSPQEAAERLHKYLTLQEPAKRSYKDCNGCEYNRTLKDQVGWQFRGCFGGDYKGKPIAEIELCPLKVNALQEPEVNLDEEITSNPSYNPNYHDKMSLYQETIYKISTILSKYEDKDGSPLEQIRSVVINDTIDKMEKESEVDLEKEMERRYDQAKWGYIDGLGSVCMDKNKFTRIARHFAEWGAKNAK